ncbi:MAG: HMA2 domain-containing protein [Dissulfurispiraceae bacterium]
MNPTLILSVLSALAATVWSVWTWSEEQQKERQLKRDQAAALYVNSFMLAIAELQSRLYNILEQDELAFYKREYPEKYEFGSPAAIEILYRLSQYFGWGYYTYRFGPYTKDPRVIELSRKIGETFESRSKFSGDAFRFSFDERASLGQAVVRRVGEVTTILPVFQSIPLFQFEEEISDKQSKHARLYQSRAVRCTLAAIDRADQAEALEGIERLAVLENLLTDLLAYLESKEGFRVSLGEPVRAILRETHAQVSPLQSPIASILHQTRGRIRLRLPRLKTDKAYASALQSLLESVENVRSIRVSTGAASVIICYSPDIPEMEFARKALNAIQEAFSVTPVP